MALPRRLDNPFAQEPVLRPIEAAKTLPAGEEYEKKMAKAAAHHALREEYEDLPESELVKRYKPIYVGEGGENLVFRAAARKRGKTKLESFEVVIKAEKEALADTISYNIENETDPDLESIRVDEIREGRLKNIQKSFRNLKQVFKGHVLPQRYFMMKVPVNRAVMDSLDTISQSQGFTLPAEIPESGWTIVSIQKSAEGMEDEKRLGVGGANMERSLAARLLPGKDPMFREVYKEVTDNLMNTELAEKSQDQDIEKLIPTLFYGSGVHELMSRADRDPHLWEVLSDFQKKAVEFSEKDGRILDFASKENIIFHRDKKDGHWTYTIIDPFYSFEDNVLERAREALIRWDAGFPLEHGDYNLITQAVNFTRVVNALGVKLGTGVYVDFLPADWKGKNLSQFLIGRDDAMEAA
jgi:hypothetical protein